MDTDIDSLPFDEYAQLMLEKDANERGIPLSQRLSFKQLVTSDLTLKEIELQYGEETAINVEIALDPDAPEWTEQDWARARPAIEVDPELVAWSRRTRGKQKAPTKERITIRIDADLAAHFRSSGKGWQTRLNETLRKAVFGS